MDISDDLDSIDYLDFRSLDMNPALQLSFSNWGKLLRFPKYPYGFTRNNRERQFSFSPLSALNDDRKNKQVFCDFRIITESRCFHVHKCLVGIASEFFKKSMVTEMKEKYENSVTIHNIRSEMMEIILLYIYGNTITITKENIDELLAASDYLQFSQLNTDCVQFISETDVTEANYLDVWNFAKEKNLQNLLRTCENYIKSNFLQLYSQKQFLTVPNDSIVHFFKMLLDSSNIPAKLLYQAIVKWVESDEKEREQYFSKLFNLLNLEDIPASFTVSFISEHNLVLKNLECLQKVMKAIKNSTHTTMSNELLVVEQQEETLSVFLHNIFTKQHYKLSTYELDIIDAGMVCVNNKLFIMGGRNSSTLNSCKLVQCFDLNTSIWITKSAMLQKRRRFGCAVVGNLIYVAGGKAHQTEILDSVECYNVTLNRWTQKASMVHKRVGCCLVEHSNFLYVLGGDLRCNQYLSSRQVEKFDGKTWTSIEPMLSPRSEFAAVILNNKIYAIGGANHFRHSSVEEYDIEKQQWKQSSYLGYQRSGHSACVLNGKIYVSGGQNDFVKICNSVEVYDPDNIPVFSDSDSVNDENYWVEIGTIPFCNNVIMININ